MPRPQARETSGLHVTRCASGGAGFYWSVRHLHKADGGGEQLLVSRGAQSRDELSDEPEQRLGQRGMNRFNKLLPWASVWLLPSHGTARHDTARSVRSYEPGGASQRARSRTCATGRSQLVHGRARSGFLVTESEGFGAGA